MDNYQMKKLRWALVNGLPITHCPVMPERYIGSPTCQQCRYCSEFNKTDRSLFCSYSTPQDTLKGEIKMKKVITEIIDYDPIITIEDLVMNDACRDSLKWLITQLKDDGRPEHVSHNYKFLYSFLRSKGRDSDADWLKLKFYKESKNVDTVFIDNLNERKIYAFVTMEQLYILKKLPKGNQNGYIATPFETCVDRYNSTIYNTLKELICNILKYSVDGSFVYEFEDNKEFIKWAYKVIK